MLRAGDARRCASSTSPASSSERFPTSPAALDRRRHDPGELDPGRLLRFPTVARLDELVAELSPSQQAGVEALLLAGVVRDVAGPEPPPEAVSSVLAQLAVGDPAAVAHVINGAKLLRAAASDVDGFDPAEIRQIATHLGSPTAADHAYLLALASGERHRQGLDELHGLISDLLAHPELLGDGADTLAEMRRNQAIDLSDEAGARRRLQAAPLSYLLTHEPDELARQARLVEPRPHAGIVRVAVSPNGRVDHWVIDVASRDTDGLLARLSAALTDAGADIVSATVATWPDGAVVDTFVVRSAVRHGPAAWPSTCRRRCAGVSSSSRRPTST